MSKNEVIKKDPTPLSTKLFDPNLANEMELDTKDILIPKMHLMQQMSEKVVEGTAKAGEFRNSIDGNLLGTTIEIFVFSSYKSWQVFKENEKGKPTYVETIPYYGNENLSVNDGDIHRDVVLGFYCLIAHEISSGLAFPYIVDFKRTSRRAGQSLVTKFARLRQLGLPSYAKNFILTSKQEKNEFGTYFVKDIETGRDVTEKEIPIIEKWIRTIGEAKRENSIKIDDSDLQEYNNNKVKEVVDNIKKEFGEQDIPF